MMKGKYERPRLVVVRVIGMSRDGPAGAHTLAAGRALWRAGGWLGGRASARYVRDLGTAWARAGRTIHWGPVRAICVASLPGWPGGKVDGALGLVDGGLVFAGRRAAVCDGFVPFDAVRWVALRRARRWPGSGRQLAVHAERSGRWQVAVFALDGAVALAEALASRSGCPVDDAGAGREDFGPARALRMHEDLYGEWHAEREDQLYLAPDRLLFGWRDAIALDRIEQVSVLERAPRAQGRGAVLRLVARVDDETYEVVGFGVARAGAWADALVRRAGGALAVGRKKKSPDSGFDV